MSKVIAVVSNKGGVAKTTTCLALGGGLAELGKTVLVLDLDPQAHLTISLGFEPTTMRRTLADVLLMQKSLIAVSRMTGVEGLDLAPANRELGVIEKVLYDRAGYEQRLKTALAQIHPELYDFVLIDCPPYFGTLTTNGLVAADMALIPVQCEYYAARSLRQMMDMVREIRSTVNPALAYRLLVTMYDVRNKVHRFILHRMRTRFAGAMFQTIIQVDTRLRESPVYGLPVTHYAPRTRAAQQYRALASELAGSLLPMAGESRNSPVAATVMPVRGVA